MLAGLWLVLQSDRLTEAQEGVRQAYWLRILREWPAIVVEEAADFWVTGQFRELGENRSFAPRPVELLRLAEIARVRIASRIMSLDNVLAAELSGHVADTNLREWRNG